MSPSVALSEQQCKVLQQYLPAYDVLSLTGKNGVDKWTDQRLWDAVLTNVRVVVGTPAVLADALTHGFVRMARLTLLVFDEAHRCTKGAPMNSIMQNFYHPSKFRGETVPHILGLSASPSMNAKKGSLELVEANLDAIAITPKLQRSELDKHVHPPSFSNVLFAAPTLLQLPSASRLCDAVRNASAGYDLRQDPYFIELSQQDDARSQRQLEKVLEKRKTYCSEQLQILSQRVETLYEQLGPLIAEWYISSYVKRFIDGMQVQGGLVLLPDISSKEQYHLLGILRTATEPIANSETQSSALAISDKAQKLMTLLHQQASPSLRGIVFVEQRATVSALVHLLRSSPQLPAHYNVGGFVGTSTSAKRMSGIADLVEVKKQEHDLEDFRNGKKNLIVATNVLEEGIDVSACNLVVCFDLPKNLVSFVQRRGRARQRGSKYYLFIAEDDWKTDGMKWQRQEEEMKQAYMNENRTLQPVASEDEDDLSTKTYRIESTEALLTLENAKAHLYHFCAVSTLQVSNYVDVRPEFSPKEVPGKKLWTATVTLPSFVHPELRTASSTGDWKDEDSAIKDAAFEAYVALHEAGLVNGNLLPLTRDYGPDGGDEHVNQPSIIDVAECRNSWVVLAKSMTANIWHTSMVTISQQGQETISMLLFLPAALLQDQDFPLYWNERLTYGVKCEASAPIQVMAEQLRSLRDDNRVLLASIHGNRMPADCDDFIALFQQPQADGVRSWLNVVEGSVPAEEYIGRNYSAERYGLVRVRGQVGRAFVFQRIVLQPSPGDGHPDLIVTGFPKRRDFLHPVPERQATNAAYTAEQTLALVDCMVDNLPYRDALFAAFVPSILHRIDIQLLAQELQETILSAVGISDISLIIEAISSPAASEGADYNRLEYLGDAILKFCAHRHVMAQHPTWPEGYLSAEKGRLVRNSTLTKAALDIGLDKYILTKPFTGAKWRPVYVSEVLAPDPDGTRRMSSKILADVVEALIGGAFVDGGLDKAYQCIQTLLSNETWYSEKDIFSTLTTDLNPCQHSSLDLLERLIGHHFTQPTLLVEAITHASLPSHGTGMSYERLEFLGDAVLDLIIVPRLFAHPRKLKHWQMHNVHEALVNGLFLACCCMSYGIEHERYSVVDAGKRQDIERSARAVHLHDFIRASGQVVKAKQASLDAFEKLRGFVDEALAAGKEYPWVELLAMSPHKFFSDVVESVLGALYIDSNGDLAVCETFVENLGILGHMRTMLDGGMETMSPKERLGVAAGNATVKYSVAVVADAEDASRKTFSCAVSVGEWEVAAVQGCAHKAEAEARAALQAVEALEVRLGAEAMLGRRKRKLDVVTMLDDDEGQCQLEGCESAMQVDGFDGDEDGGVTL